LAGQRQWRLLVKVHRVALGFRADDGSMNVDDAYLFKAQGVGDVVDARKHTLLASRTWHVRLQVHGLTKCAIPRVDALEAELCLKLCGMGAGCAFGAWVHRQIAAGGSCMLMQLVVVCCAAVLSIGLLRYMLVAVAMLLCG
jgi:hypothetical protein